MRALPEKLRRFPPPCAPFPDGGPTIMGDGQAPRLCVEGEAADGARVFKGLRVGVTDAPDMRRTARGTGDVTGCRRNTIHPTRAESRKVFNGAIGRDAQESAIVAPREDTIRCRIGHQCQYSTAMRFNDNRRRIRMEKPDHTVSEPRCNTPAGGECCGHRCARLKRKTLPFKLRLGKPLAARVLAHGRCRHAARHAAKPSSRPIVSRSRPMNTMRDCRAPSGQAPIGAPSISMCTP